MNIEALRSFIALRKNGATKLLATLPASATREQSLRARLTRDAIAAIETRSPAFATDAEISAAAKTAAVRRDSARRFSDEWHAADVEHDVLVALHTDLNPTPEHLYGAGSNPAPKEDDAAAVVAS